MAKIAPAWLFPNHFWKRQPDGSWRYVMDNGAPDRPPTPPVPPVGPRLPAVDFVCRRATAPIPRSAAGPAGSHGVGRSRLRVSSTRDADGNAPDQPSNLPPRTTGSRAPRTSIGPFGHVAVHVVDPQAFGLNWPGVRRQSGEPRASRIEGFSAGSSRSLVTWLPSFEGGIGILPRQAYSTQSQSAGPL